MSTRADIIDLLDNATEDALEKILAAAKEILREGKGDTDSEKVRRKKIVAVRELRARRG